MNSKKKGDKAELEVNKILIKWGYIINPAPRTMVYIPTIKRYVSKRNDHWGLFDVEARNLIHHLLIQVKTNYSDVSTAKKKIEKFEKYIDSESSISQIWERVQKKGFIIHHYEGGKVNVWFRDYINFKGKDCDEFIYNNVCKKCKKKFKTNERFSEKCQMCKDKWK